MIKIEQIRELENKVHAAVSRIRSLTAENERLKQNLQSYEERIDDLQKQVASFKDDQDEIEAGIVAALEHLDALEDGVGGAATRPNAVTDRSATRSRKQDTQTAPDSAETPPPIGEPKDNAAPQANANVHRADPPVDESMDDDEEEPELDIF